MKTKVYYLFNGKRKIEINEEIVKEYEEKVGPLNEKTISYLTVVLDIDEEIEEEKIGHIIEAALMEDCKDSSFVKKILSDKFYNEELFHA